MIWSDGCGYRNRNTAISKAYIELSLKQNVKIIRKYLVTGHTQIEVDGMNACLERKMVGDTSRILHSDHENSKIHPAFYSVKPINFVK